MDDEFRLQEPPAGLTATEYAAFRAGAIGMVLELFKNEDIYLESPVLTALHGEYEDRVRTLEVALLERQRGLVSDEEAVERDVAEALSLGCCGGGCDCDCGDCGGAGGRCC